MKFCLIIYLWKLSFFVKAIQCEINTTIKVYFPSRIIPSYQNMPLTEQAIYDLRNNMRKANEVIDFDDDDDEYYEDANIETDNQLPISIESTTSEIKSHIVKSSSTRFVSKFIYLLLLLLLLTQTNK